MDLQPAPFHADLAGGPPGGAAYWAQAADGRRIRVGFWPAQDGAQGGAPGGGADAARGTVLLFPGRTEYIEKYGDSAAHLARRGFATLAIDWRGQGLSERLLPDRRLGHVGDFAEYQLDIAAALALLERLEAPRPRYLIAHSMGGAIGLRALLRGLPVRACVFTGPMWGIALSPATRPLARIFAHGGSALGLGARLMPSTSAESYVATQDFAGNALTTDPDMYGLMRRQLAACPDFALGGPTMGWMRAALRETAELARHPSPDLPCLTFLGSAEKIVDKAAIRDRMARWPRGTLEEPAGAEHEVLMEGPALRERVFDRIAALFSAPKPG